MVKLRKVVKAEGNIEEWLDRLLKVRVRARVRVGARVRVRVSVSSTGCSRS